MSRTLAVALIASIALASGLVLLMRDSTRDVITDPSAMDSTIDRVGANDGAAELPSPMRTPSNEALIGYVLDEATQSVPDDVTVEIRQLENAQSRGLAITTVKLDESGGYVVMRESLPSDGWVGFIARAPGYADGTWFGLAKDLTEKAPTIEIKRIVFGRLDGRVVDDAGMGIAGVNISFEPTPGLSFGRSAMIAAGMTTATTTKSDGAFTFDKYPLNERDHLMADGGPTRTLTVISEVAAGDHLAVPPIVLLPACAWSIRVVDASREPVVGASVECDTADAALARRLAELAAMNRRIVSAVQTGFGKQYTNADGVVRFDHVPIGRAGLTVRLGDAEPTRMEVSLLKNIEHTEVILGPDSQPELLVSVIGESGRSITNFFGIDGDDWPGLEQAIRAETGARVDALALDVHVRVRDLSSTREFVLDSKEFPTLSIPVSALTFPVDVELWLKEEMCETRHFESRPGRVDFKLDRDDVLNYVRNQCGVVRLAVTEEDGTVARRVSAIFHRLDENEMHRPSRGFCFPGNNYVNGDAYVVPAGPGVVAIAAAGRGRTSIAFDTKPGQFLDLGTIRLGAGGALDIEVVCSAGVVVEATQVAASLMTVPAGDPVLLVPDVFRVGTHVSVDVPPGKLRLNSIAAGEYVLRVENRLGEVREVTVTVEPGKTTSVKVEY